MYFSVTTLSVSVTKDNVEWILKFDLTPLLQCWQNIYLVRFKPNYMLTYFELNSPKSAGIFYSYII